MPVKTTRELQYLLDQKQKGRDIDPSTDLAYDYTSEVSLEIQPSTQQSRAAERAQVRQADLERGVMLSKIQDSTDYGEYRNDDLVPFNKWIEDPINYRAEAQTNAAKIANGIGKMVITAGSTFAENTAGLVSGALQMGADVLNFDGEITLGKDFVMDNYIGNKMKQLRDWSETVLPNYRTEEEMADEDQWWKHLNANFVGDTFLKNMGFTIGAGYSGALYAKGFRQMQGKLVRDAYKAAAAAAIDGNIAAEKAFQTVLQGNKLKNPAGFFEVSRELNKSYGKLSATSVLIGSVGGAIGEARTEAIEGASEFSEKQMQTLDEYYQQGVESLERSFRAIPEYWEEVPITDGYGRVIDYETRLNTAGQEAYDKRLKEMAAIYNERKQLIDNEANDVANTIFWPNMFVLAGADAVMFGKMFAGGYKSQVKNLVKGNWKDGYKVKGGLGRGVLETAKTTLSEGSQEGIQKLLSEGAKAVAEGHISDFNDLQYNHKSTKSFAEDLHNYLEASKATIYKGSTWQEVAVGALTGFLGSPSMAGWSGGVIGSIKEANELKKQSEEVAQQLNDWRNDNKMSTLVKTLIRDRAFETIKEDAALHKDKFIWHTAQEGQFINAVMAFEKAGRLQDLEQIVNSYSNLSPEQAGELREMFSDGTDVDVNNMSDGELAAWINERAKNLKDTIDDIKTLRQSLDFLSGGTTDDAALDELTYTQLQLINFERRYNDLVDKMLARLRPTLKRTAKEVDAHGNPTLNAKRAQDILDNEVSARTLFGGSALSLDERSENEKGDSRHIQARLIDDKDQITTLKWLHEIGVFAGEKDPISIEEVADLQKIVRARQKFYAKLTNPSFRKTFEESAKSDEETIKSIDANIKKHKSEEYIKRLEGAQSFQEYSDIINEIPDDISEDIIGSIDKSENPTIRKYQSEMDKLMTFRERIIKSIHNMLEHKRPPEVIEELNEILSILEDDSLFNGIWHTVLGQEGKVQDLIDVLGEQIIGLANNGRTITDLSSAVEYYKDLSKAPQAKKNIPVKELKFEDDDWDDVDSDDDDGKGGEGGASSTGSEGGKSETKSASDPSIPVSIDPNDVLGLGTEEKKSEEKKSEETKQSENSTQQKESESEEKEPTEESSETKEKAAEESSVQSTEGQSEQSESSEESSEESTQSDANKQEYEEERAVIDNATSPLNQRLNELANGVFDENSTLTEWQKIELIVDAGEKLNGLLQGGLEQETEVTPELVESQRTDHDLWFERYSKGIDISYFSVWNPMGLKNGVKVPFKSNNVLTNHTLDWLRKHKVQEFIDSGALCKLYKFYQGNGTKLPIFFIANPHLVANNTDVNPFVIPYPGKKGEKYMNRQIHQLAAVEITDDLMNKLQPEIENGQVSVDSFIEIEGKKYQVIGIVSSPGENRINSAPENEKKGLKKMRQETQKLWENTVQLSILPQYQKDCDDPATKASFTAEGKWYVAKQTEENADKGIVLGKKDDRIYTHLNFIGSGRSMVSKDEQGNFVKIPLKEPLEKYQATKKEYSFVIVRKNQLDSTKSVGKAASDLFHLGAPDGSLWLKTIQPDGSAYYTYIRPKLLSEFDWNKDSAIKRDIEDSLKKIFVTKPKGAQERNEAFDGMQQGIKGLRKYIHLNRGNSFHLDFYNGYDENTPPRLFIGNNVFTSAEEVMDFLKNAKYSFNVSTDSFGQKETLSRTEFENTHTSDELLKAFQNLVNEDALMVEYTDLDKYGATVNLLPVVTTDENNKYTVVTPAADQNSNIELSQRKDSVSFEMGLHGGVPDVAIGPISYHRDSTGEIVYANGINKGKPVEDRGTCAMVTALAEVIQLRNTARELIFLINRNRELTPQQKKEEIAKIEKLYYQEKFTGNHWSLTTKRQNGVVGHFHLFEQNVNGIVVHMRLDGYHGKITPIYNDFQWKNLVDLCEASSIRYTETGKESTLNDLGFEFIGNSVYEKGSEEWRQAKAMEQERLKKEATEGKSSEQTQSTSKKEKQKSQSIEEPVTIDQAANNDVVSEATVPPKPAVKVEPEVVKEVPVEEEKDTDDNNGIEEQLISRNSTTVRTRYQNRAAPRARRRTGGTFQKNEQDTLKDYESMECG